MAAGLVEKSVDHRGEELPAGIYSLVTDDDLTASYKVRWREEDGDGVAHQRSKSFSVRKLGSPDRALEAATAYRRGALAAVSIEGSVAREDAAAAMSVEDLFQEWCVKRGAELSESYGNKAVRLWDNEIGGRQFARVRLDRLSRDPSILTRLQDDLAAEGMGAAKRR